MGEGRDREHAGYGLQGVEKQKEGEKGAAESEVILDEMEEGEKRWWVGERSA